MNHIAHAVHKVGDAVRFSAKAKQNLSALALKFKIVREINLDATSLNQHLYNLVKEARNLNGDEKEVPISRDNASSPAVALTIAAAHTQEPTAQQTVQPTNTADEMCDN